MDYGKMGHGAGWQPGKDAEVVGLGGGKEWRGSGGHTRRQGMVGVAEEEGSCG